MYNRYYNTIKTKITSKIQCINNYIFCYFCWFIYIILQLIEKIHNRQYNIR